MELYEILDSESFYFSPRIYFLLFVIERQISINIFVAVYRFVREPGLV